MKILLKYALILIISLLTTEVAIAQINIGFELNYSRDAGIAKPDKSSGDYECKENPKKGTTTCYYPNGKKYSEANWIGGTPNGEIRYWHPTKKLMQILRYADGKLHGKVETFRTDGSKLFVSEWNNGIQEGKMTEYYESGKVYQVSNWVGGEVHGTLTEYYENGKKELEVNFVDGLYEGHFFNYYKNGNVHIDVFMVKGFANGLAVEYHENGTIKAQEFYEENLRQDTAKYFYESGQLESTFFYRNDTLDGEVKKWTEDGKIEFVAEYQAGKKKRQLMFTENHVEQVLKFDSEEQLLSATKLDEKGDTVIRHSYEKGEIATSHSYMYHDGYLRRINSVNKENELHGPQSTFYPNGQEEQRIFYRNGVQHGKEYKWGETGYKWLIWNFEGGKKNGKQEVFAENGTLTSLSFYDNGNPIDTSWRWDDQGNLTSLALNFSDSIYEEIYRNDSLVMVQIFLPLYNSLYLSNIFHYKDGVIFEEERRFYKDGTNHMKKFYRKGVLHRTEVRDKEEFWKWNTTYH